MTKNLHHESSLVGKRSLFEHESARILLRVNKKFPLYCTVTVVQVYSYFFVLLVQYFTQANMILYLILVTVSFFIGTNCCSCKKPNGTEAYCKADFGKHCIYIQNQICVINVHV